MDYPFTLPGHEDFPLVLRIPLFQGAKILAGGVPLQQVKGRKFLLPLSDGTHLELTLKPQGLDFAALNVQQGEHLVRVVPLLPAYQYVLAALPLALMFVGGLVGGALGGGAAGANLNILRSSLPLPIRLLLVVGLTLTATVIWFIVAILIQLCVAPAS